MNDCSERTHECVSSFTLHMCLPWSPPAGGCCHGYRVEIDPDPDTNGFVYATVSHALGCDVWRWVDPDMPEGIR